MNYIKSAHTAIFVGQTGCGKTKLALDLIESEYEQVFDFIVIICPTFVDNKTYNRKWIFDDDYIYSICDKKIDILKVIDGFSELFAGFNTLFILDHNIVDEKLDKKKSPFLELSACGRHRNHSLWLLTQSYTCIPKNVRRQAKMLYVFKQKDRNELKLIHDENDCVPDDSFQSIKNELKKNKYGCLVLRNECPTDYKLLNC